jgi:hypothetical protein
MSLENRYDATLTVYRPGSAQDIHMKVEAREGGNVSAPDTKHRNVVTRDETARGGLATRSNVVVRREADADAWALRDPLEKSVGKWRATVVWHFLDRFGSVVGDAKSVSGIVTAVNWPNYDLQGDAVGLLEIEVAANEKA